MKKKKCKELLNKEIEQAKTFSLAAQAGKRSIFMIFIPCLIYSSVVGRWPRGRTPTSISVFYPLSEAAYPFASYRVLRQDAAFHGA